MLLERLFIANLSRFVMLTVKFVPKAYFGEHLQRGEQSSLNWATLTSPIISRYKKERFTRVAAAATALGVVPINPDISKQASFCSLFSFYQGSIC